MLKAIILDDNIIIINFHVSSNTATITKTNKQKLQEIQRDIDRKRITVDFAYHAQNI